jgi:hypothetical protein
MQGSLAVSFLLGDFAAFTTLLSPQPFVSRPNVYR